ncbi:predicted protein [Histoplasma mississippiense (nom. inval.)]|uniref:predicted protein n=1 Tax=Ajellomyces capsulatus (strain NAm1 / WU24) TaxID=2059318 RepID=UPI000157CAC7|nr:predicted protein [Histoplasma mississippiense (nom. inval.)]EDN09778.1 predicted protein [Histoplasma mississippiense (nom. inval.)]
MPEWGSARPHRAALDQTWTALDWIGRAAPSPAARSPSQRILNKYFKINFII